MRCFQSSSGVGSAPDFAIRLLRPGALFKLQLRSDTQACAVAERAALESRQSYGGGEQYFWFFNQLPGTGRFTLIVLRDPEIEVICALGLAAADCREVPVFPRTPSG